MIKIFSLLLFMSATFISHAQCDSMTLYTKDIGNGINQYALPFKCVITKDSIVFSNIMKNNDPSKVTLHFKILSGSCNWESPTDGNSVFKAVLIDGDKERNAIINIRSKDRQGRIQILYSDTDEVRVLNMK